MTIERERKTLSFAKYAVTQTYEVNYLNTVSSNTIDIVELVEMRTMSRMSNAFQTINISTSYV